MTADNPRSPAYSVHRMVDQVPSPLSCWDRELRCCFANRACESWFGVQPGELVGMSMQDLLGPESFDQYEPHILRALQGEAQTFECVESSADGLARRRLVSCTPDIVDGVVNGFTALVNDITEVRAAEARLQARVASLEAALEQARAVEDNLAETRQSLAVTLASIEAGFIATDRQGRVVRMNAVSERLTGWPASEAIGQSLWTVFKRDDRPTPLLAMNPVDWTLQQGVTVDMAHRVTAIARDGTRTAVEAKAALTYGSDGSLNGMAVVLRDMSRVVQAEVESSRLAAIVESSNDPIISKTLDGRITSWNAAAEALFGWRAEEAIGQSIQMLIPAHLQHEEMAILSSISRGVRVSAFETVRRTKSGKLVDVSVTISPIRDAHGRIAGASKIVRDVTLRNLAEKARAKAKLLEGENRQIQEANRLKSQFLANMSHELRTPLNAIIGFADLLQSGVVSEGSPKHRTFLGHIASSGRHLLRLINDVLDLSKVESGKFEFFPEPLDLTALVQEVKDILQAHIDDKQIRFEADIDPHVVHLELDAIRLKQVLFNLLSNALKFTPAGGKVAVRASPRGPDHFLLEVQDSGIGVAAENVPRLFSEFVQIDAEHSRVHQGTGLGLALTRHLVEAQGGSVGVTSEPGVGSVFFAVLNRIHGTDPVRARAFDLTPSSQRVLVVEPDVSVQQQLVQGLAVAGFEVDAATTADQAAKLALDGKFEALTLGMQLPDQAGLGFLAALREATPQQRSPVIGVTMPTSFGPAASFAISDILSKPLSSEEVALAMASLGKATQADGACVMVIDDDPLALTLMRTTLSAMGISSVCLPDGRRALAEIALHRPVAIILDLMMPGFDGFDVLDGLHRLPQWRDTPVFIWTSMILTDQEYAALSASARAIVSKGGGNLAAMLNRFKRRPPLRQTLDGV